MNKKSYYISLQYDIFFPHPEVTTEEPKYSAIGSGELITKEHIELIIINANSESIAKTISGNYLLTDGNISFDDPRGLMTNLSIGEVHLILAKYLYYNDNDDTENRRRAEVIHADMVDTDHLSEFRAFALNYNGKPKIKIPDHPETGFEWDVGDIACELNAPYIIVMDFFSFVCKKIEVEVGCTRFNEEFNIFPKCKSSDYGITPGDVVQLNYIEAYGDWEDGFSSMRYELFHDIENVGGHLSQEASD